jgi:type VI secretion system protein ImpE
MSASDLFKAGQLQAALDAQIQEVRARPADQGKRLFLFELAAFAGDLERARRQIDVLQFDAPELNATKQGYLKLLESEDKRRRLFRDGLTPKFLGEAPDHVKQRLEAVNRLRENNPAEAAELLNKANEGAATLKGTLNGKPFEGLRDADDLFGTVLEVLAQGEYFWVPLEQIDSVALNGPKVPRDLLWMPARLTMREGESGEVFVPVLYPGSHEAGDEGLKLGRSTDWKQTEGGPVRGVGLRTFLVGEEGSTVPEWRELLVS